ncbi:DUF3306 domain-containing protein [Shewanella sp. A32]|uniref:DUF3306 domain-containing protein n=1 Tax=Shewanella sp. A32 TaxID=3031327 RepID=UPI0023B8FEA5|nr:DUF3306 domain-containing protein [Shewanella sp. A32]MDF0533434.1 DUF3306 domain-containing protein [Shewanella sp. A32]
MAEERSFLSRWAQRKQQAQQGTDIPDEPEIVVDDEVIASSVTAETETAISVAAQNVPASATDTDSLLTADDLPDPDSIEIGGSFASFMANNVDPDVKKNALRALWKQPHFSEIDGMMEYALDYSCQPTLSAEVSSQLAKKVFRHLLEKTEDAVKDTVTELADAPAVNSEVLTQPPAEEHLADNLDERLTADSQNAASVVQTSDKRVV